MGKIYLGNSLIAGEGGGTQPTGQVTTTFTLPQDVQDMLTVPHGIVIFGKNSGVDTLANSNPNITWCVGYYSVYYNYYDIATSTTVLTSYAGSRSTTTYPFSEGYKYFSSKVINGTTYYGSNRSRYSIAVLSYKSDNTSNVLPSLTITVKIIKITNGNLITETYTGTVQSKTATSSNLIATIDLAIAKGNDDLICLIEVDSITVN